MSNISSFAKSGFWDYKNIIVPAVVAAPLVLESAILTKNIYQNPSFPKEKLVEAKNDFIKSFTPQKEETKKESIIRISKNVFIAISCLSLMAGAAYLSIVLLPASIGISIAISLIFLIGKIFLNAKKYKDQLIGAFTAKPGEDAAETRQRIFKNVIKVALITALVVSTIFIGAYILTPLLTKGFSWSIALPFQTKGIVFAEYASLGVLHGGLAYSKYKKGDKAGALFHLFAGALSFAFPSFYWNNDMRLHHSFYGLLMMAIPSRATRFLGSLITFDSSLYMIEPVRGFVDSSNRFRQYDFINSVVDNFPLFVNSYTPALIAGNINNSWAQNTKEKALARGCLA